MGWSQLVYEFFSDLHYIIMPRGDFFAQRYSQYNQSCLTAALGCGNGIQQKIKQTTRNIRRRVSAFAFDLKPVMRR